MPTEALAVWLCQRFGTKRKSMLTTLHTLKIKKVICKLGLQNRALKASPLTSVWEFTKAASLAWEHALNNMVGRQKNPHTRPASVGNCQSVGSPRWDQKGNLTIPRNVPCNRDQSISLTGTTLEILPHCPRKQEAIDIKCLQKNSKGQRRNS